MAVPVAHPVGVSPSALPEDWNLPGFDFAPRTRIIFGPGTVARIGDLIAETGATRILVVTDPGIVRVGHAGRVRDLLAAHDRKVEVFDRTRENPDTDCIDDCLALAREFRPDAILGLGGGSSMDTAKGCNFLLTNGGRMQDYWGVGKARLPMLPFIAIPTTAGTGSECQSAALIADARTHVKMACLDAKVAARVAILDPDLTLSQPPGVTACTGIDALAHAVETAVTLRRNASSMMYSREAFRLLVPRLPRVMQNPKDRDARSGMLLGAAFAGCAIETSMLGAAHSAANPMTAHFQVVHGVAVGVMLPHVIRFNAEDPKVAGALADLASAAGIGPGLADIPGRVAALISTVEDLLDSAGIPDGLAEAGVDPAAIPTLAGEAARQWTASFNPRPVGTPEFIRLYSAALAPRTKRHAVA